jgi:hypothetical protein
MINLSVSESNLEKTKKYVEDYYFNEKLNNNLEIHHFESILKILFENFYMVYVNKIYVRHNYISR